MHHLLLLRNFHDLGAADLPIVMYNLNQTELKAAMEYWVSLSKKGNAAHPDRPKKCECIVYIIIITCF